MAVGLEQSIKPAPMAMIRVPPGMGVTMESNPTINRSDPESIMIKRMYFGVPVETEEDQVVLIFALCRSQARL